jgi:hypothetical protein
MKTLACVLALLTLFVLSGCGGDYGGNAGPQPPSGNFDGEFFLDPSVQGSVDNVQVAVYESEAAYVARQPLFVTQTDANGRYFIDNVPPEHYVLDAFKDNDGDGRVTSGDYYLAHTGCPGCAACVIVDGSTGNFWGTLKVVQ